MSIDDNVRKIADQVKAKDPTKIKDELQKLFACCIAFDKVVDSFHNRIEKDHEETKKNLKALEDDLKSMAGVKQGDRKSLEKAHDSLDKHCSGVKDPYDFLEGDFKKFKTDMASYVGDKKPKPDWQSEVTAALAMVPAMKTAFTGRVSACKASAQKFTDAKMLFTRMGEYQKRSESLYTTANRTYSLKDNTPRLNSMGGAEGKDERQERELKALTNDMKEYVDAVRSNTGVMKIVMERLDKYEKQVRTTAEAVGAKRRREDIAALAAQYTQIPAMQKKCFGELKTSKIEAQNLKRLVEKANWPAAADKKANLTILDRYDEMLKSLERQVTDFMKLKAVQVADGLIREAKTLKVI